MTLQAIADAVKSAHLPESVKRKNSDRVSHGAPHHPLRVPLLLAQTESMSIMSISSRYLRPSVPPQGEHIHLPSLKIMKLDHVGFFQDKSTAPLLISDPNSRKDFLFFNHVTSHGAHTILYSTLLYPTPFTAPRYS